MLPGLLLLPMVVLQAPAPLPVVEAKDLPKAPRGPMVPHRPDVAAEASITGETRRAARRGPSIPALQLPAGSVRVTDKVPDISGWRAYAIEVPAGGKVKVHVVEGRKAWFRVLGVNAWGRDEPGLLQNRIATGEPQATYENPTKETRTIYFIVDTLDANMIGEPFTLEVTRG
ncbi:hypothetical protein [Geothrix oryzisoli]|uniref:hypothetical protein n=1 Tax=Geothrix oryzisoli TaxID=2922721 RepID=UPI001FAC6C96|nr:hypothetical protein [Geothrix oryzisoli]